MRLQDVVLEREFSKDHKLHTLEKAAVQSIKDTISKVYDLTGHRLVRLPGHVLQTLEHLDLLESVESVSAHRLNELLPSCCNSLQTQDRLNLLQFFFCCDNAFDLLKNTQLLPLEDGTFGCFEEHVAGFKAIFWCEDDVRKLFPGLESTICRGDMQPALIDGLRKVADSGK